MKVTIESICREEEYLPSPGTQYEIADGVVVTMKRPYEAVVNRYLEFEKLEMPEGHAVARLHKLDMLRIVCDDVPDEVENVLIKVVDRVLTDFFTVSMPTVNAHTRSLLDAMAVLSRNGVDGLVKPGQASA